jgi:phytoene dehydrogenase-like protein
MAKYDDADVIIVGGNVSALVCAAALAKSGLKVIVLEKESTPGGSYKPHKSGSHVLDTGFRQLGDLGITQVLDWLMEKKVWWTKMKEPVSELNASGKSLKFMNSLTQTMNVMRSSFIDESSQGIFWQHFNSFKRSRRGIFHALKLYHMPQSLRESLQEMVASDFIKYHKMSIAMLIEECGFNDNCKLTKMFSVFESAGTLFEYILRHKHGAYYPKNGLDTVIFELSQTIRTHGSYVLTDAEVTSIKPVEGTVVVCDQALNAEKIISAVSLQDTFALVGRECPELCIRAGRVQALIALKSDSDQEIMDKIIIKDDKHYVLSSHNKDTITVSVGYDKEPNDEEKNLLSKELLEIAGVTNPEWIHIVYRENKRMVNDKHKIIRACKPTTQHKRLYITGKDMMHSDSLEASISAGYLTANSITNFGTILDILTGNELIKVVE